MREEEASRALEALGLTGKEASAYLGLLRNGVSTAQEVSRLLGVQYPAVYRILESLESKGGIEVSQERPDRDPAPAGPPVLRILADALSRSHRPVRLVLNEANRPDVAELGGTLSPRVRVQFPFPARPLPKTRLAHTFVFPNDREVFILNSFYRDGDLIADRLQGLWVGDADFVRVQLEAMLENIGGPKARLRRG